MGIHIIQTTDATSDLNFEYIVVELNAMRVPDHTVWEQEIALQLENIRSGKYKMIVAVNDTALTGLLKYAKDIPQDLPIVFTGCEL